MIKEKLDILIKREKPKEYTDVFVEASGYGKKKIKNRYLICDYCGEKISLDVPKDRRTGGTMILNKILTHKTRCTIAACNKCVIPILNEF